MVLTGSKTDVAWSRWKKTHGNGSHTFVWENVLVQLKCLKTKRKEKRTKKGERRDRGKTKNPKYTVIRNYSTYNPFTSHVQPLSAVPHDPPVPSACQCCWSRTVHCPKWNLSKYSWSKVPAHPINVDILTGASMTWCLQRAAPHSTLCQNQRFGSKLHLIAPRH